MADSIEKWKLSLCELIEKNLKRTHDEVVRSCAIAALLSIQMGMDIEEEVIGSLSIMRQIVSDASVPENVRSLCAQAIGICCYFSVEQVVTQQECLLTLRQVWWQMKPTTASPGLFSSAIFSWVLLLERVHPQVILKTIEETQPKLCTFLTATTVDVRISAGEALAVLFEIAVNDIDQEFRFANHEYLKDVLGELAIDSAKYHAKRDKKVQKFSFRQINDAIFNNSPPQSRVRFNKHETLQVEGCHSKLLYDSLCQLLKGDVNLHLTNNVVLRELFDLGPVLVVDEEKALSKAEKVERMNALNADSKARNIHRGKQRDKKVY
ncbi:interferon-related developmental regulator 2-like protein [Aphelenchoides avenae]|nr:interferon-related developmental regulator 2-like protein [Aphelenchus avenae]